MATRQPTFTETIDRKGFAVIDNVLSTEDVARLSEAIDSAIATARNGESVRERNNVYAIRNVTEVVPEVGLLHNHPTIAQLVHSILGNSALLVRGLLFDKSPESNWGIFWHQDLSIAVTQRHELPGFGPWSVKAGIQHVQPPPEILESMLTVRLHLDDCPESNGALRVLPGSHRSSRLSSSQSDRLLEKAKPFTCSVKAGGAVVMRPLLLHSSQRAHANGHRRVIHLEFASGPLPEPLEWHIACPIAEE